MAVILVFLVAFGFKTIWVQLSVTGLPKYLPVSAHDVYHEIWEMPDETKGHPYCVLMRADMPETGMAEFVKRVDLKKLESAATSGLLLSNDFDWQDCVAPVLGQKPEWWDPTGDLSNTFFTQTGKSPDLDWVYAKWENGKVYAMSFNWSPAIQRSMTYSK